MSRQNKVNPDHYKVAGRLSMDDLARERRHQGASQLGDLRGRHAKAMPPWMTREASARADEPPRDDSPQTNDAKASTGQRAPAAKAKPTITRAHERTPRRTATPQTRSIAVKTKASKTTARKAVKTTTRKTASKRTAKSRAR